MKGQHRKRRIVSKIHACTPDHALYTRIANSVSIGRWTWDKAFRARALSRAFHSKRARLRVPACACARVVPAARPRALSTAAAA
eukprot:5221040-Pleurochrysis_carterae.AAC.3